MTSALKSLIDCGTKLWLDSIDPQLVEKNRKLGATGATSNPIIITDLLKSARFDSDIEALTNQGLEDEAIAWAMTDKLVSAAQEAFLSVWQETSGNDGYVSFELDPLLEDLQEGPPHDVRVAKYIELGKQWAAGHQNRMIKVPATPAGLDALEELVAAGITVNVTLIFSLRQYQVARDAVWRGAKRRQDPATLKSVYSIFVSRVDVYTEKHIPKLTCAQGEIGIVNAKLLWTDNQKFWADKNLPLQQEIIFASTGTKKPEDDPWKYVQALAGSDIQTNPPATNDKVEESGLTFTKTIDQPIAADVLAEFEKLVDIQQLEETLMAEGLEKFANPQKALLALIAEKRAAVGAK